MVRESEGADERTLDEVVRDAMAEWQIPGVTVAVLHGGKVETHGYGVISLETNYPTRPDTLFQVGSNSKVFTATLVMRLVEAGLLDLDTPIGDYLPDLRLADPRAATTVTLRHLLSHTSGLEGDRFEDTGEGDDAVARYVGGPAIGRRIPPPASSGATATAVLASPAASSRWLPGQVSRRR
jgi:CubicO group peptidase (beta-lactamase class C family)